jgi:superfamily II DNA or RNA helicase
VHEKSREFSFTGVLRPHQAPIVAEATEHLDTYSTTTLWVYPGAGKTAMGMYLASAFTANKPVLICICKTALIDSWRGTVASFTNVAADECYVVPVGAISPPKLEQAKVVICMDLRLKKLPVDFRAGVCIIDEAHMWCKVPNRVQNVLSIMCEYVILETATFQLDNGMERFLTLVAIVKVNTRVNPKIDGDNAIHEFRTKLLEHPDYNRYVLEQVRHFGERKILILTWLRDHVASMAAYLAEHGVASSQFYGDMAAYKDENVIIGTFGKIGVGFDEVFLASGFNGQRVSVVILPLSVSDTAFFEQCLGRGFRCERPTIVLFIDSHFISANHWRKNQKWIDAHDVDLTEVCAAATIR